MTVITNVDNQLYGGRSLVGFTEEGEYVASWPELTYESLRAINHLTGHGPIPAPTLYRVLGELKGIGHLLPQACAQLARGLEESLHVLDVYDHKLDARGDDAPVEGQGLAAGGLDGLGGAINRLR